MSPLEERYRRVLRLLPASYRAVWADEMVATFLDGMLDDDDPDEAEFVAAYGRPGWAEVASVATLAVRLRLGSDGGPARYVAWGRSLRLMALIVLFVQAVISLVSVGIRVWAADRLPGVPGPAPRFVQALPTNRLLLAWEFADLLWVVAFVALALGHRRAARVAASLAVLQFAVHVLDLSREVGGVIGVPPLVFYGLGIEVLAAASLAAFHRGAAPVRARRWLVALPLVSVGTAAILHAGFALGPDEGPPLLDWPGLPCIALVLAAAGYPVAVRLGWIRPVPALPHALTLLAPVLLGYRLVTLLDLPIAIPGYAPFVAVGMAEAAAVLVAGTAMAVWTAGTLRRLPSAGESAAAWTTPA